eukprot:3917070-Rhodomonas_salina.3
MSSVMSQQVGSGVQHLAASCSRRSTGSESGGTTREIHSSTKSEGWGGKGSDGSGRPGAERRT